MTDSVDTKGFPLVPPHEERCVWMTAGILSYQLCELNYDCEHCPLDAALRTRFPDRAFPSDQDDERPPAQAVRRALHPSYFYSTKHTWVKPLDAAVVRVGIEPGLASLLLDPKAVVFPAVGERVFEGKVCAWVVLEGGTMPIASPVDGTVRITNAQLVKNPHLVPEDPMNSGWLFELGVEQDAVTRTKLLPYAEARAVFEENETRLQKLIAAELAKRDVSVGGTLADGGQFLQNVTAMLGPVKYFQLVRSVFGK